jgi:soluble lytic murein transglycosylase
MLKVLFVLILIFSSFTYGKSSNDYKLTKYDIFLIKNTFYHTKNSNWIEASYYARKFKDNDLLDFLNWIRNPSDENYKNWPKFKIFPQNKPEGQDKKDLDTLLWANRLGEVKLLLSKYPEQLNENINLRIILQENNQAVKNKILTILKNINNDEGLKYDYIRWCIKNNDISQAIQLIEDVTHYQTLKYPEKWWHLKKLLIREIIYNKLHDLYYDAYKLAKGYYNTQSNLVDGEWLAGWIAIDFLDDPQLAITHFSKLDHIVTTPISKSRSLYWLGRSYEKISPAKSKRLYKYASSYSRTFYGQIAALKLNVDRSKSVKHFLTAKNAFNLKTNDIDENKFLKIAYWMSVIDENRASINFLMHFFRQNGKLPFFELKHFNSYIRINAAKFLEQQGFTLSSDLYPVDYHNIINSGVFDNSLVFSIIRQESEFDHKAESLAGARGIMQVMPSTGKFICNNLDYCEFDQDKLYQVRFNINLGIQLLKQDLAYYKGSLVPTIAAYNAGKLNVNKWIEILGEFESKKTIDEKIKWIESVPFSETRNYIMRVLESMRVYDTLLNQNHEIF